MRLGIVQPLTGIGDMVILSNHIQHIALHYQADKTILFAKKATCAKQYGHLLGVDEVCYLPMPTRTIRPDRYAHKKRKKRPIRLLFDLSRLLKSYNLDAIIIIHRSPKYAIASYLANIPLRYGYGRDRWQKIFLTQKHGIPKAQFDNQYFKNIVDALVRQLNITQLSLQPQISLPKKPTCHATISIGIGASGVDKQWGQEHFTQLFFWLLEHTKLNLLLCGGPSEQYIVDHAQKTLPNHHWVRMAHTCQQRIDEAMQGIQQTIAYVGNDTGFMQIAVALGKPTLGLFGSPKQAVLDYSPLIQACTPELTDNQKKCTPENDHMAHISTKQVTDKLSRMLHNIDPTIMPQLSETEAI